MVHCVSCLLAAWQSLRGGALDSAPLRVSGIRTKVRGWGLDGILALSHFLSIVTDVRPTVWQSVGGSACLSFG